MNFPVSCKWRKSWTQLPGVQHLTPQEGTLKTLELSHFSDSPLGSSYKRKTPCCVTSNAHFHLTEYHNFRELPDVFGHSLTKHNISGRPQLLKLLIDVNQDTGLSLYLDQGQTNATKKQYLELGLH